MLRRGDFIEIGVGIVSPLQASAREMHSKVLKESFGEMVCSCVPVDAQ